MAHSPDDTPTGNKQRARSAVVRTPLTGAHGEPSHLQPEGDEVMVPFEKYWEALTKIQDQVQEIQKLLRSRKPVRSHVLGKITTTIADLKRDMNNRVLTTHERQKLEGMVKQLLENKTKLELENEDLMRQNKTLEQNWEDSKAKHEQDMERCKTQMDDMIRKHDCTIKKHEQTKNDMLKKQEDMLERNQRVMHELITNHMQDMKELKESMGLNELSGRPQAPAKLTVSRRQTAENDAAVACSESQDDNTYSDEGAVSQDPIQHNRVQAGHSRRNISPKPRNTSPRQNSKSASSGPNELQNLRASVLNQPRSRSSKTKRRSRPERAPADDEESSDNGYVTSRSSARPRTAGRELTSQDGAERELTSQHGDTDWFQPRSDTFKNATKRN